VGITERSAHRIVGELCDGGYLARKRIGSRNQYTIRPDVPIHDPLLGDHSIGEILAVVAPTDGWGPKQRTAQGRRAKRRR
jgi:hypothetical protein